MLIFIETCNTCDFPGVETEPHVSPLNPQCNGVSLPYPSVYTDMVLRQMILALPSNLKITFCPEDNISSLQCYSVLSIIAQVLRKMSLKILAS